MELALLNRVARKVLETLFAYSREFGDSNTAAQAGTFGLTKAEFRPVIDRLVAAGLAHALDDGDCLATPRGLEVAGSTTELDHLFPVNGNPDDPLPSELVEFGSRPFTPAANPPPPMAWEEYDRHLRLVWPKLLNSDQQHDEAVFQEFLEKHPSLLPSCYEHFQRGASAEKSAYYKQPELPGFRSKKPDFMTIMFDSQAVIALLIEIEAPGKRWATDAGIPSAKLNQALDQLREWKAWFQEPENILQFKKLYQLNERLLETRQFTQRYALIYGRRAEASANPNFARKRMFLANADEVLMSYDRLHPCDRMRDSPTVRLDRSNTSGLLAAVHVPPTIRLGPHNAEALTRLSGLRDAIAANQLLSGARKRFLLERIDYWEWWSRQPLTMQVGAETTRFYAE